MAQNLKKRKKQLREKPRQNRRKNIYSKETIQDFENSGRGQTFIK